VTKDKKDVKELDMHYDWTYTTDYKGAIEKMVPSAGFTGPNTCKDEINVSLLKKPDPILWYQHLVLFEDELHDNGISSCFFKVRVMPSCFLVLLRFWLRVDGVLIRLRDTRVFHEFDTDYVLREYQAREESFDSLTKRGLPKSAAYYKDPDSISRKIRVVESTMEKLSLVKPPKSNPTTSKPQPAPTSQPARAQPIQPTQSSQATQPSTPIIQSTQVSQSVQPTSSQATQPSQIQPLQASRSQTQPVSQSAQPTISSEQTNKPAQASKEDKGQKSASQASIEPAATQSKGIANKN